MKLGKLILAFLISIISKKAISAENVGQAVPWGLNLREPFSPFMAESVAFHNELLWLVSIISLFVLALMVIIVLKYNAKSNPKP